MEDSCLKDICTVLICGLFAGVVGGCENPFSSERTRETLLTFPRYKTVVRHGNPFGIVSLSMEGQPGDFSHPDLPLADWEWFWYGEDGQVNNQKKIKILNTTWPDPKIENYDEATEVLFEKTDVLMPGLDLEVRYSFGMVDTFSVSYTIKNSTGELFPKPYMMVGFPGFSDSKWVSTVSTSAEMRFPKHPFTNFLQEAGADGREEYTLLREDLDGATAKQLTGAIGTTALEGSYILKSTFSSTDHVAAVSAAHVNKARYLTSHLYVSLNDLRHGEYHTVHVSYRMSPPTVLQLNEATPMF